MRTFERKALVAAVALSALVAFTPARADVMAGAMVDMSNFRITNSLGTTLDATGANTGNPTGDFSVLTFTSSAGYTTSLTGFVSLTNSSVVPSTDFAPACLGAPCPVIANNVFPKLLAPPVAGNYAVTDQLETGAPVTGITGLTAPARVANGAYVGLTAGTGDASGVSDNNLNASFIFRLAQAGGIQFKFDINAFLQAYVTSTELFPGFATASYTVEFSIKDLTTNTTVYTFAPDLFGNGVKTVSLNAPLPINIQSTEDTGGVISFSSSTVALNNTDLYQLSARIEVNADASRQVPEPATLSLLGLGLLAAGFGMRRSKAKLA